MFPQLYTSINTIRSSTYILLTSYLPTFSGNPFSQLLSLRREHHSDSRSPSAVSAMDSDAAMHAREAGSPTFSASMSALQTARREVLCEIWKNIPERPYGHRSWTRGLSRIVGSLDSDREDEDAVIWDILNGYDPPIQVECFEAMQSQIEGTEPDGWHAGVVRFSDEIQTEKEVKGLRKAENEAGNEHEDEHEVAKESSEVKPIGLPDLPGAHQDLLNSMQKFLSVPIHEFTKRYCEANKVEGGVKIPGGGVVLEWNQDENWAEGGWVWDETHAHGSDDREMYLKTPDLPDGRRASMASIPCEDEGYFQNHAKETMGMGSSR